MCTVSIYKYLKKKIMSIMLSTKNDKNVDAKLEYSLS